MQEQNAAIGVAIAGYYPDITLSGAFGYYGNPFVEADRRGQSGLVLRIVARAAAVQRRPDGRAGRGGQADLRSERRDLSPDRADRVSAGRGSTRGDPRPHAERSRCKTEAVKAAEQAVQIALNEYRAGTQNFTTVVTAEAIALSRRGIGSDVARATLDRRRQPRRRSGRRMERGRAACARRSLSSGLRMTVSREARNGARRPRRRARRQGKSRRRWRRARPASLPPARRGPAGSGRSASSLESAALIAEFAAPSPLCLTASINATAGRGAFDETRDPIGVEEALHAPRRVGGERRDRGQQRRLALRKRFDQSRSARVDEAQGVDDGVGADEARRESSAVGEAEGLAR